MKLEQRQNNRILLSIPVNYKVYQIENLEQDIQDKVLGLKAEIQDLSLGGTQIVSSQAISPGSVLELNLDLADIGKVQTVAKVIWTKPDLENNPGDYRSGIQFVPVYEEDLQKLEDYFKRGRDS
jgi:c-di-GMP-binding flagellar brake protein YcgR